MNRSPAFSFCVAALLAGCAGDGAKLAVRAQAPALAEGQKGAAFRVAEARGYFELGSIGLATEGFRRALREDPASVDALNGLAACYDKLGRFDLSRSYYERALALAPGDARLYANLALSLQLQGKAAEAKAVRTEMTQRLQAASAVSVPLAQPVAVAAEAAPTAAAEAIAVTLDRPEPATAAPRLERVTMAEVMLVTAPHARAAPTSVARTAAAQVPSLTPMPKTALAAPEIRLLNAARTHRLAADTRLQLRHHGWQRVAIGNADAPADRSAILYPERHRKVAQRLGRQLGIDLQQPSSGEVVVVRLGRDAARRRTAA